MAKSSAPFTNFTAGELSPRLDGRTDLAKYFNGCKKLQNFLTFPQGGVTRRPGTEYIADGRNAGGVSYFQLRLIPFEFNVEQTYILEFSAGKFRIFKDGGIVVDGGGSPVEVVTQYSASDLSGLKFTQSADIMYIVHPNHAPRQITRTDHDAWTITDIEFRRGPFLDPVFDDSTLLADGRTGSVSITSSVANFFKSTDVGRLIKLHHGYAEITSLRYTLGFNNLSGGTFSGGQQITTTGPGGGSTAIIASVGASSLVVYNVVGSTWTNGVPFESPGGVVTANATNAIDTTQSEIAFATVQENDELEEELEPSFTATTISFHEGDPDATGLAHNDFIEDSGGHFISEGFKVGMRISASGSVNIDIATWHIAANKIEVTCSTPHRLINGDLVKFTGVSDGSLTITFTDGSAADINVDTFEVKIDPDTDPETRFQLLDPKTGGDLNPSGSASGGDLINGNNFSNALIVAVSDSIITLATSNDVHFQNEGASITLSGDLIADDEYQMGAFSETTGYPACIAFFEQRLAFANTATQPQTLFFSVSGDYTNFTSGTADDSALIYTIGSNQVNVIRYLTSSKVLIVGTSGGEFAVRAGSVDAPITPLNTQIKQQAKYGSADIQPLVIGATALFVQREKRKLRELIYNYDVDSYTAPDMTLLAEHITEGKIKEMAYQQEPNNVVWCVLEDGKLVAMTYRREEDVVAWHEHQLGGTLTDGATTYNYGFVESIASISSGQGSEEEVYVVVRRTINGVNVRHVERLKPIDFGTDVQNAFYVDDGLTYTSVETELNGGISASSSVISLDDASSFSASGKVKIGTASRFEIVSYASKSGNDLIKVTRGQDGTSGNAFADGQTVTQLATTISGLDHLEGQTVSILANGATHPDKVVSSGSVTLDRSVTKAHIGLPYDSILQTMRIEAGGTEGTAQAKTKRISDLDIRVLNSVGAEVGPSEDDLDLIPFRKSSMAMDQPVPLYTGDKFIEFPGGYSNDGFVVVKQDQPLPLTILSIYPRLQTFDR
jgi:hypothetical protein